MPSLDQSARLLRRLGTAASAQWDVWNTGVTRRPVLARQALDTWLSHLATRPLPSVRGRVALTALRSCTWIEWAAYAACVLRTLGWETTLLYRGEQVRREYPQPRPFNFWARVPDIPGIALVDLDAVPRRADLGEALAARAREIAAANVAYDFHIEEADVRANPARYGDAVRRREAEIVAAGEAFDELLTREKFSRLLCYSGLIAESPGLLAVAQARRLPVVCLEGWAWRPGHMIYNLGAPAMEYNVTGWLRALGPWDAKKDAEINAYLKFLDGNRPDDAAWLNNFYRIQRDNVAASLPTRLREFVTGDAPVFLLAPNVIGDSSMLCRETIFPGQQEWVRELIRWFAARPQLKLVIRAHPAERWIGSKCAVYMGEVARAASAGVANVHVIDSAESVNTFALIPFARAGLAWLSSAGVDFVVRGLPAVVAAKPKYSGLGIVEEPLSRDAYFSRLAELGAAPQRPTADQIVRGKRYLHLTFKGFSYEAAARDYRATGLRFGAMPSQAEHDRFFRIITGDEPMPDCE